MRDLKALYQEMADFTLGLCTAGCRVEAQWSCCHATHCEEAIWWAKKRWSEVLEPTGHPTLPLLGPDGCVAPAHCRPICATYVCDRLIMVPGVYERYAALREAISNAEFESDPELSLVFAEE